MTDINDGNDHLRRLTLERLKREAEVEKLLTKGEAATFCRVTLRTIDYWMAHGKVVFSRLPGGGVRFKKKDLLLSIDKSFDPPDVDKHDSSMG